jgi:nickel-dependent lactate racemase
MLYINFEKPRGGISDEELFKLLDSGLNKLGDRKKVLIIPPDITRIHSYAGEITQIINNLLEDNIKDIMPALGTHRAMTKAEIMTMYGDVPVDLFRAHDWRNDVVNIGEIPGSFISEVSGDRLNYSWPAQVNRRLLENNYDLILSVGQVVPHEVAGMAGYNKNILIGCGGSDAIHRSHFLGAVMGAESLMGRSDNPVRKVLNKASDDFLSQLPICYLLTVIGRDDRNIPRLKGLYLGDDIECFNKAAALSVKLNICLLDKPVKKVVAYLDPLEYHSTWLGNKSIYRSRMMIEDGGELLVIAPGVRRFGEDSQIDELIRKYGYLHSTEILELAGKNEDLKNNLSAAAHLIHGTSDGRFKITYAAGKLTPEEVNNVHYEYSELEETIHRYDVNKLKEGHNIMPDGEEIYYISNPALGLWAHNSRFQ